MGLIVVGVGFVVVVGVGLVVGVGTGRVVVVTGLAVVAAVLAGGPLVTVVAADAAVVAVSPTVVVVVDLASAGVSRTLPACSTGAGFDACEATAAVAYATVSTAATAHHGFRRPAGREAAYRATGIGQAQAQRAI